MFHSLYGITCFLPEVPLQVEEAGKISSNVKTCRKNSKIKIHIKTGQNNKGLCSHVLTQNSEVYIYRGEIEIQKTYFSYLYICLSIY